ncbi:putative membrane protein [Sphingobacterium soli]|nr:putative membrane protein [Sphingobacterium soli]
MIWLTVSLVSCIAIAVEDFLNRMVHIVWYSLLMIGILGYSLKRTDWEVFLENTLLCLTFIAILILLMTLYFSIKEKKIVNLFDQYLGLGDILFFIVIGFYFDIISYILFFIGSLLISLLFTPIIFKFQGKENYIPLAGLQSVCFALYCILDYFQLFNFKDYLNIF